MSARPAVLHILSDWKWTGPAEPVANLCRALWQKGFPTRLACAAPPPGQERSLASEARERQLDPVVDLHLDRRPNFVHNWQDVRDLAEIIDREGVAIVHVHSTHDHYIGSRAAQRANNRPFVIRTNHTGAPLRPGLFGRWLLRGRASGWVAYSRACLEADCRDFRVPIEHGAVIEGAIDLERFTPRVDGSAKRAELGFGPEDVVFGVVARIQPHRRFPVILKALQTALAKDPRVRGLILGRGTRQEELVDTPLKEMGLADRVLHPGYRMDDYVECLAAMDALVFLVPGSDGSCRAAREAMAVGKPVIASRRGGLPELVEDGRCGLVIEDTAKGLAEAMLNLARDRDRRVELGRAASAKARARFRLDLQAQVIGDLYMGLARRAV